MASKSEQHSALSLTGLGSLHVSISVAPTSAFVCTFACAVIVKNYQYIFHRWYLGGASHDASNMFYSTCSCMGCTIFAQLMIFCIIQQGSDFRSRQGNRLSVLHSLPCQQSSKPILLPSRLQFVHTKIISDVKSHAHRSKKKRPNCQQYVNTDRARYV